MARYSARLDYHQPPPSLITKWRTQVALTQLEFTARGHWNAISLHLNI